MPSRSLADADPILAEKFLLLAEDYAREYYPLYLTITATYRSPAEQQALYAQGRTKPGKIVTQLDGVKKLSKHNYRPARALDVMVRRDGIGSWDVELYRPLVELAKRHGLVSGGAWKTLKDFPHLELP